MGRRTREKELEGVNLLGLAPFRRVEWEEVEGRVVLLRPPPRGRGLRRWASWISYRLSARRIRLDRVGSAAWRHLDGTRTVREVARLLEEEFGQEVAPAEERLGRLVRMLRGEELLGYPGWDEEG